MFGPKTLVLGWNQPVNIWLGGIRWTEFSTPLVVELACHTHTHTHTHGWSFLQSWSWKLVIYVHAHVLPLAPSQEVDLPLPPSAAPAAWPRLVTPLRPSPSLTYGLPELWPHPNDPITLSVLLCLSYDPLELHLPAADEIRAAGAAPQFDIWTACKWVYNSIFQIN